MKGENKKLSLPEAVAMAVGSMIGASIFTIFGIGAEISGRHLPEAFILSGLLALMVAYSFATLGGKIISNAGPIAFIQKGFGDNALTGSLAVLLWLSYVVSISLFIKGFAGYLLPLLHIPATALAMGAAEAAVLLFFTALNCFGSKTTGRVEFGMVIFKLSILFIFIAAGFQSINPERIYPSFGMQATKEILTGSIVFFLSYMGFGLITNASENIENPERNVPRAIYICIFLVIVVYVLVAAVAIGNLPLRELISARDNALAIAAKPFFGSRGFVFISTGALISIASALNATIYGGANIAYALAKEGELPVVFERKAWFGSNEGLSITAGLGLLFALLFDMTAIASIMSSVSTIIYIFVLSAHYRLAPYYGGSRPLIAAFTLVLSAVLAGLLAWQLNQSPSSFYGTLLTLLTALAAGHIHRHLRSRNFSG
ncbi:APC family permease [Pelodictyon luteolum]|uniref:Amino acid:proton symporter, ABT family n=1 Tax=Chlorobium luteolum (strain DSM 273 / BCRC 81028 / 2530) TaxID=319225 RepID=Q3B4Q6_CHLL3|nr:APC family permease [Pelodictyon luteolum]ABB23675.1 amino acid:proton symporter, ABT family [Pelodictyon luteolum DSM 273]